MSAPVIFQYFPNPRVRGVIRFLFAVVVVAISFLLRQMMVDLLGGPLTPFLLFYPAVIIVALWAGLWPGIAASLFAAAMAAYFLFEPLASLEVSNFWDAWSLLIFMAMGTIISVLADRYRRGQEKIAQYERERASSQKELQFRILADAIPQLCWMAKPDGWIFWYNQRWYDYTGKTPEEMEGWGWQSVHDPKVLSQVMERWKEAIAEGKPLELVFPLRGSDGSFRPFLTRVMPVKDEAGQVVRWFGTNTDIALQVATEEELRRRSDLLKTIIREVPIGLAVFDRDMRYLLASKRWLLETGLGSMDVIGQSHYEVFPDIPERWKEVHRRGLQGIPTEGEEVWTAANKSTHWIRWVVYPWGDREPEHGGILIMSEDITARKQAELELETEKEQAEHNAAQLRTILENMTERLYVCDRDGKVLAANEASRQIYRAANNGNFPDSYQIKDYVEVYSLDGGKLPEEEWPNIRVLRGERVKGLEVLLRIKETGENVILSYNGAPVYDRNGEMLMAVLTSADITDRKKSEAALRESEEQLRLLNQELEERVRRRTMELEAMSNEAAAFSYSVSHDLRSPLRTLDGFSQILLEDHSDQLDERGRHYLERIRAAAQKMNMLIDALLRLSRLTRSEMEKKPVDLTGMAMSVIEELRRSEPERVVEVNIEPGMEVSGDSRLLQVAIQNLLSNAWKFTSKQQYAKIEFGKQGDSTTPVFFVRDNGAGFDMQYAEQLFGPFQRLHSESEFSGTGIGLATVKRVILRHHGRIWAEASVGKGATFYFLLGL